MNNLIFKIIIILEKDLEKGYLQSVAVPDRSIEIFTFKAYK